MDSQFYSSISLMLYAYLDDSVFFGFNSIPKLQEEVFHSVSNRDKQLDVPVLGLSSLSWCFAFYGSIVDA